MKVSTIVGFTGGKCKRVSAEQNPWQDEPKESEIVRRVAREHIDGLFGLLEKRRDRRSFGEVERELLERLFAIGRLLLALYATLRHERGEKDIQRWERRGFRRRKQERKHVSSVFGRVTYWRTYMRKSGCSGVYPLDRALGLTADGFTFLVMEICARLSTLVSYEQTTALLLYFYGWSPSKTSVEKAVLGFGHHAEAWFEAAPPPEDDGEILVIQIDSKATPTATEEELEKRRGKRSTAKAPSARHRGRLKRARRGPKKRRRKGDKSKNGKAATLVVMYSLERGLDDQGNSILLGPINKRVYASYGPKRHAFAIASREAAKRGFTKRRHRSIQIVTDGDEDLERLVKEYFSSATHTLDIMHALEYFWEAGRFVYPEGSKDLEKWVRKQERLLYEGKPLPAIQHVADLEKDVGEKARARLIKIRTYLMKRVRLMKYDELRKKDLEVGSGVVEGAVRHVIGKRFDSGGMRWIRERAEALLKLRAIEINGDWDAFVRFTESRVVQSRTDDTQSSRLLTTTPAELPKAS